MLRLNIVHHLAVLLQDLLGQILLFSFLLARSVTSFPCQELTIFPMNYGPQATLYLQYSSTETDEDYQYFLRYVTAICHLSQSQVRVC